MPKVTVTLQVLVTLDVPKNLAAKVSEDDLIDMARHACPDSSTHPGCPDGVQVLVKGVAQLEDEQPVFADSFVEHDITDDPELEFETEDFTTADA